MDATRRLKACRRDISDCTVDVMTLETWLAFVALEVVLCLTPGPAVLYVVSTAVGRGARGGLAAAFGIVAANTFYFLLSALGIAAIILASARLFTALKWLGAAYLVWLGLKMLLERRAAAPPAAGAAATRDGLRSAFLRGFAVQAANPKALAFFVALLPQFVAPERSIAAQMAILCATSASIEFGVLALYTWVAVRARSLARGRLGAIVQRVAGGFLVAAGARLALARSA
jgi:threonine/homoserine/homoserine lactone efflux protein